MKDLSFFQCGGVVLREVFLYENSTDVPAFLDTNQSTVMFFSEMLSLHLTNVAVTQYYGFAIIAANPYRSPSFSQLVYIFDLFGEPLCAQLNHTYRNYTCYGSGMLIYISITVMSHPSQNIPTTTYS